MKNALAIVLLSLLVGCEAARPPVLVYAAPSPEASGHLNGGYPALDLYQIEPQSQLVTRLTQTPGVIETDPCLDVKRVRLVYATHGINDARGQAGSLVVQDLVEGSQTFVYRGKGRLFTPAWSNKGDRIAFVEQQPDGRLMIKIINADGTGPTEAGYGSYPSWRADDKALFLNEHDKLDGKPGNLVVRNSKTGITDSLSLDGDGFINLQRGTSIAYTSEPYSRRNQAIWLLNLNNRQTRLSEPNLAFRDLQPVHINGTKLVAFTRIDVKAGKAAIYVVDRYAEDPVAVPLVDNDHAAYTRGGALIFNNK